ncbi:MAG TPA: Rrf2 family transcriptional regulator, partial [bacterium]|nr:Rrf2 family transcriptional regulator [bacterium]
MMKLSKKVDYGLILLSRLDAAQTLGSASAREMAEQQDLPQPMVASILKALTAAGILTSTRGVLGGYTLARDAASISLADVVQALDGPLNLLECTGGATDCTMLSRCPLHDPVQRVHQRFAEFMASYTLAEIFGRPAPLGAPGAGTVAPRAANLAPRAEAVASTAAMAAPGPGPA